MVEIVNCMKCCTPAMQRVKPISECFILFNINPSDYCIKMYTLAALDKELHRCVTELTKIGSGLRLEAALNTETHNSKVKQKNQALHSFDECIAWLKSQSITIVEDIREISTLFENKHKMLLTSMIDRHPMFVEHMNEIFTSIDSSPQSTFSGMTYNSQINELTDTLRSLYGGYEILYSELSDVKTFVQRIFNRKKFDSIQSILKKIDAAMKKISEAVDFLELANTR
jgi:DNA-binding ferritin-like protein